MDIEELARRGGGEALAFTTRIPVRDRRSRHLGVIALSWSLGDSEEDSIEINEGWEGLAPLSLLEEEREFATVDRRRAPRVTVDEDGALDLDLSPRAAG